MTEHPPEDLEPPVTLDDDADTPRWVKAFGIVALLLFLAFVGLHLRGGGLGHRIADHVR